jgi:S-formylglutathione hydrolase FrmB
VTRETDQTWHSVELAGKRCDLFEPSKPGPYVLLHLHGEEMETLAGNAVSTAALEARGLRAICPHGKRSWWANRICREFDEQLTPERHLLQNVVPFIATHWGVEPPGIGLSGVGMGGQGALRLAMKHAQRFPVVAAISSAIDYHNRYDRGTTIDEMYPDKEAVRQDTAVLYVHPLNVPRHILFVIDPADREWFDGNQRLHEKLSALGIPHEYDFHTTAGGHHRDYLDRQAPRAIDFVCRGLDAERLRVRPV